MDIFDFVKSYIPMDKVLSAYGIPYSDKEDSITIKTICPFDYKKNPCKEIECPSNKVFTVSKKKNIFYCFECNVSGDAINFIERMNNMTPIEVLRDLISSNKLKIPHALIEDSTALLGEDFVKENS